MYTIMCILLHWKCCLLLSDCSNCRSCLLLLKFHVYKSCAGAAAAAVVVVRHRAPDDAICCCGFFSPDTSVYFSLFKHDLCECTPWQCCRICSLDLPVMLYSWYMSSCMLESYGHARTAARRDEAPL